MGATMKIVIASDSFKGSCSSEMVAESLQKGIHNVFPEALCVIRRTADGGEGTIDALVSGMGGRIETLTVKDPLGNPIEARYGVAGDTAIVEMASASGLTLIPPAQRDPLVTTTFGTGELIRDALEKGCRRIIVGLGGSGTNDAGVGMAQALGCSFKDARGREIGWGGGALSNLETISMEKRDPHLEKAEVIIACDVVNPLTGESGASRVYGSQKGATPEDIAQLEENMERLSSLVWKQLGVDKAQALGAGAAGGLGFGLMVFCGAVAQSGIETVLDAIAIDKELEDADLVITGEGRVDGQSLYGKVPFGVARRAKKYDLPVLLIAGGVEPGAAILHEYGVDGMMATVEKPLSLEEAIADTENALVRAGERAMRLIQIGMHLHAKVGVL